MVSAAAACFGTVAPNAARWNAAYLQASVGTQHLRNGIIRDGGRVDVAENEHSEASARLCKCDHGGRSQAGQTGAVESVQAGRVLDQHSQRCIAELGGVGHPQHAQRQREQLAERALLLAL